MDRTSPRASSPTAARALESAVSAELLLARATGGPVDVADVIAALAAWLLLRSSDCARAPGAALLTALGLVTAAGWPVGAAQAAWALAVGLLVVRRPHPLLPAAAAACAVAQAGAGGPALLAAVASAWTPPWLAAALALAPAPHRGGAPPRPHVVLVTVDAWRADALPADLAAPGPDAVWAPAPWTLPSLASLWTARAPQSHGAGRAPGGFVGPSGPSTAALAAAAGWRTVALSGPNPFTGRTFGLLDGFQDALHPWSPVATPLPRGRAAHARPRPLVARLLPRTPPRLDADTLVDAALAQLDSATPTLLWLHLMDLHLPLHDPPCGAGVLDRPDARAAILADPWWSTPDGAACWRTSYEAAADRVAHALRRLREEVSHRPVHLVLTADHGEALGDAGLEHGHTVRPEVSRVPLAAYVDPPWPRQQVPIDLVDVGTTLRRLMDLPGGDGRDLRAPVAPRPLQLGPALYGSQTGYLDAGCLRTDDGGAYDVVAGACATPRR